MNRYRIFFIICLNFLCVFVSFGQNLPPEIIAVGNQNYCVDSPTPIVSSVSITDPDVSDTTLPEIFVQISEGYEAGQDNLALTGVHPNITASWSVATGTLTLTGTATFNEFEAALLDVVFTTTQTFFTANRGISINLGSANFLPSTGHYYFYVPDFGISWPAARAAAEAQTFFGLQGYLATITTIEEAQLAGEQSAGAGWIGATDAETEGQWQWVTGPEAGLQFWQGTFTGTPVNGAFSFWNDLEPNNFGGNEDYAHVTDPSIGLPGSWNDLPIGGDPDVNSPFHPQGYIVEFGGLPGDPTINLSAATTILMPQTTITNVQTCNGTAIIINVDTNTDEVIWFDGQTSNTIVNTGNTFNVNLNTTTTYWVLARFAGCSTTDRVPLTVTVNDLPQADDIIIQQCDDASADGISVFELNNFEFVISAGITANRAITFFEDAALTLPINAVNYNNTVNNQVIFAQVTDTSTNCFSVAEVTLTVSAASTNTYTLKSCDDEQEDGITEFDLTLLNSEILLGLPATTQTRFYPTFNDAILIQNQLPNNYTNTTPNTELIYVRIQDGNDCLGIDEINLVVNPLPQLEDDETLIYCLNDFPAPIILSGGVIGAIPNNFFYNWSTGETTIEIEVNEPGVYTVEVMEVNGCSNLRTITVLPSNTATITSIDVVDAIDNNSLTVNTTGEGDYEFSIDNEIGPYQDDNTFNNVRSGIRTVFVRDKNGCGIVSQDVAVVGFPKFFTPNGDANNDFWTVDGFNQEFLQNSRVQIFNRHGKLLIELSAQNPSWDGRYNGNIMPTDDYWFTVTLQDGRRFASHFTLKR